MTLSEQKTPIPSDDQLKERAVSYYRSKAATYTERYTVEAGGDLLWTRHNAVLDFVREWNLPAGARILDMGCGPGVLTRALGRMGFQGVGMDASPAMIEISKREAALSGLAETWSYVVGDVEEIPAPDKSFDVAISSGVIDYLPSDEKLIAHAARVLKPGGRFILCFTNRFGYTISLSTPLYWMKKIRVVRALASLLRSRLVGGKEGAMTFDFLPRKHSPSAARNSVINGGFQIEADRYVHYSVLPAPFCTLTSKLNFGIDEKLGALDRTRLRGLGSCYIVSASLPK
jgi:ubiquinone/menaquinone biosynthesis C-methylase UbiE